LRKIFFQSYKEVDTQYTQVFNLGTSTRNFEEDLELVGLGSMPEKPEGTPITYQEPKQGGKKRYTHISFGLGFRVTMEMWEDDLYGPMKKMPKELGKAARNVREVRAFNVLNNGFSTEFGFTKNGSNEALFNTAHTLLGGGTLANRASTDADFGVAALEAAVLLFDNLVDELGFPITLHPRMIVYPPGTKQAVREILGSEYRPYTNNNEVNAVRMENFTECMVRYLTDTDSWFVFADKSDHDFNFVTRTELRFQNDDDFDTGDAKYKSFQRFSVGAGDWRGSFGSQGA
jgi:phage major head subunit gpT-like protein